MNFSDFSRSIKAGKHKEAERVLQLMEYYNELGQSRSTGYCQMQRIGVEQDLKAMGYKVRLIKGTDQFEAVKIEGA